MARWAPERGIEWFALTDRDTVRFAKACADHGVRPIFGVDLAVGAGDAQPKTERSRTPVRGGAHVIEPAFRVTLVARNAAGWARLCRLVSAVCPATSSPNRR
nr:PHP domain-containing protein [Streptomyces curacoi]